MSDEGWSVDASREDFERIRSSKAFRAAIRLARAANALRFCQYALLRETEKSTPVEQRERINAFLYASAVLYEGMVAAKQLSPDLRHLESFQEHVAPLFRDKDLNALLRGELYRLRNKGVFHFGDNEIPEQLDKMDGDRVTLLVSQGSTEGELYYALADIALLYGALGVEGTLDEVYAKLAPLLRQVARYTGMFTHAVELVMVEIVQQGGWEMKGSPPSHGTGA